MQFVSSSTSFAVRSVDFWPDGGDCCDSEGVCNWYSFGCDCGSGDGVGIPPVWWFDYSADNMGRSGYSIIRKLRLQCNI